MLVIPIIAPTAICINKRKIGGILIGLFPIVSISSIKEIAVRNAPMMSTIVSRCNNSSLKSPKI